MSIKVNFTYSKIPKEELKEIPKEEPKELSAEESAVVNDSIPVIPKVKKIKIKSVVEKSKKVAVKPKKAIKKKGILR